MQKILIIEDSPEILLAMKDELSPLYQVFTTEEGRQGLEIAQKECPDLILLDLLLPDINGFVVCQRLKEIGIDSSIIMVTAKDQLVDKIKGLELGADDYITKPFSLEELKARIKAVLRRRELSPALEYKDGVLEIDFRRYKACKKQKPLAFSPLEFKLLRFLISRKKEVITREELLGQVWGYQSVPSTRTVDVHMLALRKKIGRKYIATIHGQGYCFKGNS